MAAQCKSDLLDLCHREFARLDRLIGSLTPAIALAKDAEDTSIKDIIAHRAHWVDLFLGWYADGLAGKPVHFPAKGYKWNALKRYNADLRARQVNVSWAQAVTLLHTGNASLLALLENRSDAELYGGPMQGAKNNWTPGRWAEAAGPSHYRSAAKYIRSRLKTLN